MFTQSGRRRWELKTGLSTARPITIVRDTRGQHGSCFWLSKLLCRTVLPLITRAELDLFVRKCSLLGHVQLFVTPWIIAHQAPPSMGFSRQGCWSRLPFPFPRDLPDPAIESTFPALQVDSLLSEPTGKPGFQKGICLLAGPLFLTLCKPKPDHSAQTSQMLSMQMHWRGGCWNP